MTITGTFLAPISQEIWSRKYRFAPPQGGAAESSLDDTLWRVARAAAAVEKGGKKRKDALAQTFFDAMADYGFLPGGRILAGAGTGRSVTLFNCFVLGTIGDDLASIFDNVKEAALTMQAGGGIGHDFSTLRPKGALVRSIGADASGPVSFMDVWDSMCRTIMSAGQRRGAMMATMRCDHPDIEDFIAAKADPARLRNFNLSVLVTDAFMAAVDAGKPWDLTFDGKVYRTVAARDLWDRIMRATYDYAEPGVIFIDRVNAANNLSYCETIAATNPCGEQPLPPYGACLLGSINLAALVDQPFSANAGIDLKALHARVAVAIRLLDNIIDVSRYPLPAQAKEARAKRRIGLGVTGLADALIFCGLSYGSAAARTQAAQWMAAIQNAAYAASAHLASEKGAFPLYDREAFLARPNISRLRPEVQALIAKHGIRNGCLTSIAPTGTISLLAGNVSSGIEPVFDFAFTRRVLEAAGQAKAQRVEDYAYARFRDRHGHDGGHLTDPLPDHLPPAFVTAGSLTPAEHLAMQAVLQPYVDSAISKTINCPAELPFEAFRDIYRDAYRSGLKGCTTYRPNAITGAVLIEADANASTAGGRAAAAHAADELCCAAPVQPAVESAGPEAAPPPARSAQVTHDPAARQTRGVVYMTKPLERDAALEGVTYKIKWPASPHALYVTINDIVRDGRRRPFEIFINNLEHYAWTVALTRMISAVFRRGGDVTFVAEELKAVFDPEGGRWMAGRYVPSLLAAIGDVIEEHMIRIGFLVPEDANVTSPPEGEARAAQISVETSVAALNAPGRGDVGGAGAHGAIKPEEPTVLDPGARICPRCGSRGLRRIEGCWTCATCQYSRCG